MEVDVKQASESLSTIEAAQTAAERFSQNNGIVHFVWVGGFMICMVLCDATRAWIVRSLPYHEAVWAITAVGTSVCVLLGIVESIWRRRYMRSLPVMSSRIPSRWTYFRSRDGLMSGWNNVYLITVWLGLMWVVFSRASLALDIRTDALPYLATLFGVVVTLPTFIVGCRLWFEARGRKPV